MYLFSIPIIPVIKLRDSKGRYRSPNLEELKPIIPISSEILNPLVGNLLGDGHLRFTHKGKDNKAKPNTNALFAITLKNKDYIYHLWTNIYRSICTELGPRPWPNLKSGLQPSQYTLNTKSIASLTLLHYQWYR